MTAKSDRFQVEVVVPPVKEAFFSVREKKTYGRVWNLTLDETIDLWTELGASLDEYANRQMEDPDGDVV